MRTIRTAENRLAFLDALALSGNVFAAAHKAGIGRTAAYNWRAEDPDFAREWEAALELGTDALEDEAVRRAYDGTIKPVFYRGVECGGIREYSDTLLIFMLKARRPERFAERRQHTGADGGPISYVVRAPAAIHDAPGDLRPTVVEAAS